MKFGRPHEVGIHTLSDVRLVDEDALAAIEGISADFAGRMKEIVVEASQFDFYSFELVGAAE